MPKEQVREIFVENLRFYLAINGKTQRDLIEDLGYSSSIVSNWCTGKKMPRIAKVEQLAMYFGIETSDLLERKTIVSDRDPQIVELEEYASKLKVQSLATLISIAKDMSLNPENLRPDLRNN